MAKPFRQLPLLLTLFRSALAISNTFTHCALQSVVFPTLAVPLDRLAAYQIILIEVLEEYTDIYQIESHL
jgi:hypothetical protein